MLALRNSLGLLSSILSPIFVCNSDASIGLANLLTKLSDSENMSAIYGAWNEILDIYIRLSAQSIVHGDVLSEKINFSAHGSSNSANFGPDYLDP